MTTARRMLRVAKRQEPDTAAKRCRVEGADQYSSASMTVRTRSVTLSSAGSGEAVVEIAIEAIDLPEDRLAGDTRSCRNRARRADRCPA